MESQTDTKMEEWAFSSENVRRKKNAYDRIFIRFYSPLCEYASHYVSDADAEELVQDLMLHVWNMWDCLATEETLKSYLFVSVKNRCYNFIRNRRSRSRAHSAIYEKIKDQFEEPDYYLSEDIAVDIEKAVEELPESYRETFKMSRFGEMTNADIAARLNISVKTVEYRIGRSLKILYIKLKDYLPLLILLLHA